jgi:hypothetical protein
MGVLTCSCKTLRVVVRKFLVETCTSEMMDEGWAVGSGHIS